MSLKLYVWGLALSSVLCIVAFGLTIAGTNPEQGGEAALLAFYLSLYFGLLGILTLAGYLVRRYVLRNELKYAPIRTAFRQSALVAGLLVIALLLQSFRLLTWWDILLLASIALLLELYLRAYART